MAMHVTTVSEWITQTRETQILMASEMHAMTTWMEMVRDDIHTQSEVRLKVLMIGFQQKMFLSF